MHPLCQHRARNRAVQTVEPRTTTDADWICRIVSCIRASPIALRGPIVRLHTSSRAFAELSISHHRVLIPNRSPAHLLC